MKSFQIGDLVVHSNRFSIWKITVISRGHGGPHLDRCWGLKVDSSDFVAGYENELLKVCPKCFAKFQIDQGHTDSDCDLMMTKNVLES